MFVRAHVQVVSLPGGDLQRVAEAAHHLESLAFDVLSHTPAGLEVRVERSLLEALLGSPVPASGECELWQLSTALTGVVQAVRVHPEIVSPF